MSQDDVAQAARACGLSWGRSTVAQLEAGTKRISAEELLLLPMVLKRAFDGQWRDLADLLRSTEGDDLWLELSDEARIHRAGAMRMFQGVAPLQDHFDLPADRRQPPREVMDHLKDLRDTYWPGARLDQVAEAERDCHLEAEQKAARSLNTPAMVVSVAAHRHYGRALTDERDARVAEALTPGATPRSRQAVRGHVTRTLIAELRGDLEA